ncbi:MAG: 30S ribosomal protein S11 [Puniceicoccales bacterium]|jgi:small subunit ribosomal protein S11|nr:30S ribosomal protein S11 [Puniceicoccales bacterium]
MSEDKDNDATKVATTEEKGEKAVSLFDDVVDTTVRKAKKCKNITKGICNILATFNNTKVSFASPNGNIISWASAGKCNFRGSRKSTAYAAQMAVQDAGKTAMSHGMKEVSIKVKGPGMGRDAAIRTVQVLGLIIDEIIDITPIPHNGCRPRKVRRP